MRFVVIVFMLVVMVLAVGFLLSGCPPKDPPPKNVTSTAQDVVAPWQPVAVIEHSRGNWDYFERLPVNGGWIYRTRLYFGQVASVSQVFVPDPSSQAAERPQ